MEIAIKIIQFLLIVAPSVYNMIIAETTKDYLLNINSILIIFLVMATLYLVFGEYIKE